MDRGRHRALLSRFAGFSLCAVCSLAAAPRALAAPRDPVPSAQVSPVPPAVAPLPVVEQVPVAPPGLRARLRAAAIAAQARQRDDVYVVGGPGGPVVRPREEVVVMGGGAGAGAGAAAAAARRLAQMTPEERKKFEANLQTWQQMPPEERATIRREANERNMEEVAAALRESGLQLDPDQREIFALRYMQERRKLERDIQDQAAAERARRMPLILNALRNEFSGRQPGPAPKAMTPAVSGAPVPNVSVAPAR